METSPTPKIINLDIVSTKLHTLIQEQLEYDF